MIPIILAGGSGTRLWPLSRHSHPKQFRAFLGEHSLFVRTLKRVQAIGLGAPIIACNHAHRFLVAEQLREAKVSDASIILEPEVRNTAPAIALAVLYAHTTGATEDDFVVLPSDHLIGDEQAWAKALKVAQKLLPDGYTVCLGAEPTEADSNYGYIQRGEALNKGAYRIAAFVEKPEPKLALNYLEGGDHYWNCGMFVLRGESYLQALKRYEPKILTSCKRAIASLEKDLGFVCPAVAGYAGCPSISVDYAVMERTERGAVVPVSCAWSDLGNWHALWSAGDKDAAGNVVSGDVVHSQCTNNLLMSTSRLLTAVNVKDTVVVETDDAVMVASKTDAQDVKLLLEQLQHAQRKESDTFDRIYRPWGYYRTLVSGNNFQVKTISVNPRQRLSLQMHHHRAEHWVVVEGRASVQCEERTFVLEVDQSTYIPLGSKHRLSNETDKPLKVIEVQSGSYLGEDDIVRFDDMYGR